MANENKGITLAQIRSGAKEFVLDNSTVSDDIRAVQVALRVLGYRTIDRIKRTAIENLAEMYAYSDQFRV